MKAIQTRPTLRVTFLALAVAFLLGASGLALAQGPGYALDWWTVDGGGHTFSQGGGYTLGSTVGQPDAYVLSDGDYTLAGGFWGGAAAPKYRIYLPLVLRNYP
jgi:hypothetical protein